MEQSSLAMHAEPSSLPSIEIRACGPDPGEDGRRIGDRPRHELVLAYRGVTDGEIRSVHGGRAEFALVFEPPLIVLCFRFGDAIPWSPAIYRWRGADRRAEFAPEARASIRVSLVEADEDRVVARRNVTLSRALTQAWNTAIGVLTARDCSSARYRAALAQFERLFPGPEALLARAIVRSIDGD